MERFINILIIDHDIKIRKGLKEILAGRGNNVLQTDSIESASQIIKRKEIGVLLINIKELEGDYKALKTLQEESGFKNNYTLLVCDNDCPTNHIIKAMNHGAVDYVTHPFNPNLIRSKIEVYKSLYYKDQRIAQLLSNIFPETILGELSTSGKYSPKRVQNGIVLFTDFVDFSSKAKKIKPLGLIKKLEHYFIRFDEIIQRYNLEKIKTIGDSYMALAGVTEDEPRPAIRACLAALEIRDFMRTERDIAIALKRDFWEIRIGLHMGPLVAGIIGTSKYSFDVWGDTVNVASRAEQASKGGHITITSNINDGVSQYFTTEPRGKIDIKKRGGSIEMFYLSNIKERYSLDGEGRHPDSILRKRCGLPEMDFIRMRNNLINRLRSLLPEEILYHDIPHTLNVEKAVERYARLEGISEEEILLLKTAALYHDAGFIYTYHHNEDFAINMAKNSLPAFGYNENQINTICNIIEATKSTVEPRNLLEEIMCDADHDYLGRPDYYAISKKLRAEMENFGTTLTDHEWTEYQLNFLENNHSFHTETAKNIRSFGKKVRIQEIKKQLKKGTS